MATSTSITTTYAGEDSRKWISQALLSGNTLANKLITVMPNIKYKQVIHRFDQSTSLVDATCDFTATGTVVLKERYLQPEEFQVNKQLCKKDFRGTWEAIEMGYSVFDVLPKSFADYMVGHEAKLVAQKMETNIWAGVNANTGEFDGFETLLTTEADQPAAQEVAGTTVTAATVLAELQKVIDATPTRLLMAEGFQIYVAKNVQLAYIANQGGFQAAGVGAQGVNNMGQMWYNGQPLYYQGYPLVVANGMTANKMIATTKDNLWFGTGLLSDHNEVKVIDMADIDGSQNVRIVMRMTAAVNYGVPEDIVTYGITNSAN